MSTEINKIVLKRGTTAKAQLYTGPVGELVIDSDLRTVRVQDNVTPGGVILSKDGHTHAISDVASLQITLDAKAPLISPALTGIPTVPTAILGTNSQQIASTAFVVATVAGSLSGNAATATKLATPRSITLGGDLSGSVMFDGSSNVTITAAVADDSHAHTFANLLSIPTTLVGYGITDAQPLDSDLTAIAGLSTYGFVSRTSTGAAATRSFAVSGTGLSIANADGIAGNPTITSNATSTNSASAIVARDTSGNFSAGTITAALSGNALTATALQTARNIAISGDGTGTATSFNGSADISIPFTLAASGVAAGTYKSVTVDVKGRVTAGTNPTTLAGYGIIDAQPLDADLTAIASLASYGLVALTASGNATSRSIAVSGTGLSVSNADGIAGNPTVTSNATNANTASTIVARDVSGNFSAGTITAALSGNATTATTLQTARTIAISGDGTGTATSFNGSANITVPFTLASTGVTAGTYTSVTVDAKGRVTAGSSSTTVTGGSIDGAIIGATTPAAGTFTTLSSTGNAVIGGSLTLTGNLTINGTTTTVNSTTVTVDDPIITLGGDTSSVSDDNKDRGVEYRWHNGTTAKVGFFGYDDSTGMFTFIPDATNTGEVFSGTVGTIQANLQGSVTGNATTATTLATTRNITVSGDATATATFNGSADASLTMTLASTGVTAGTYGNMSIDAKGRVTAITAPTDVRDFGILVLDCRG